MIFHAHLNSAKTVLAQYKGQQPFPGFLKAFFKRFKKFGSTDRKNISALCYAYLRIGNALPELPAEEKIKVGLFLTTSGSNDLLQFFQPEWNHFLEKHAFPDISQRILFIQSVYPGFQSEDIFSFSTHLSPHVNKNTFILSHLQQPDLFIRIRPGYLEKVVGALKELKIASEFIPPMTMRLPASCPVETIAATDKEIVIQDYSSQRTGSLLQLAEFIPGTPVKVWDCCAASGGKSIMAFDLLPEIRLDVSDSRKSILENLYSRFSRAGILHYRSFIKDMSAAVSLSDIQHRYDLIIVDAPCTGSGTWGRNPEQLSSFNVAEIGRYSRLQQNIVTNAIPFLSKKGYLLYITCSVYKEENELVVEHFMQHSALRLVKQEWFDGYGSKADTLFAALFTVSPV